MANVLNSRVWQIDTTGTLTTDKRNILMIDFVPAAEGDSVQITESSGALIWEVDSAFAEGRIGKETFKPSTSGWPCDGIIVSTLTSGAKLYIWFKNS